MATADFTQTKYAPSVGAVSSLTVTFDSAVQLPGAGKAPSLLLAFITYDGNTGSLITGATDSQGNTWQVASDDVVNNGRTSNGAGVNFEPWMAVNAIGGFATSVTFTFSSPVTATVYLIEIDQACPVRGLDRVKSQINVSNSTTRQGALGTKGRGMIRVVVEAIAWNNATFTCSATNSNWKSFAMTKTGNLGLAIGMRKNEVESLSANIIPVFTVNNSPAANPVALCVLAFFRDGVQTCGEVSNNSDDDGWIDDIEGIQSFTTTDATNFVLRTSTTAPVGGTGTSEYTNAISFFRNIRLLYGASLGTNYTVNFLTDIGNDDLQGFMHFTVNIFKNGQLGDTLDIGDYSSGFADATADLGTAPCTVGSYNASFVAATAYRSDQPLVVIFTFEGDGQGLTSSTYAYVKDWTGSAPAYLKFPINYGQVGVSPTQLLMGRA